MITAAIILKPPLIAFMNRDWIDLHKIPKTGGCVIVFNHVSHLDPLTSAHLVDAAGRTPRYLAKSGLFENRLLGGFLRSAGQIPVARMSADAVGAFAAGVQGIHDGKAIIVYPEGTITRDPDGWPMRGKSGAARIALATGVPGHPRRAVGSAGSPARLHEEAAPAAAQDRAPEGRRPGRPLRPGGQGAHLRRRHAATDRIMAALTRLVEDLRGEKAPEKRFDPRTAGVQEIGNPR